MTVPPDQPTLGLLGTGIMGAAMARRWAGHSFTVTAWNRDRKKAEALRDAGVAVADSPAHAARSKDFVVTMLADGDATENVMHDALPAMSPDTVWLQMATVGLDATDRLAALAAGAGVSFVDAPVSGTRQPAEKGALTVLAGAAEEIRARCDPVFQPVAARVLWVGRVGAGSRLKLVINTWLASLLAGLAESIALAEALGTDPRLFLTAIDGSPLGSAYATVKGQMMIERAYPASFPLHLLTKDMELVADAARDHHVPMRLPDAIRSLLYKAGQAHGDDDMAAIIEALRP